MSIYKKKTNEMLRKEKETIDRDALYTCWLTRPATLHIKDYVIDEGVPNLREIDLLDEFCNVSCTPLCLINFLKELITKHNSYLCCYYSKSFLNRRLIACDKWTVEDEYTELI